MVDPSSMPVKPPRPRVPTTTSSACRLASTSVSTGEPSTSRDSTVRCGKWLLIQAVPASSWVRMSAKSASRSIGAGTHASDPLYCGTEHTSRSGAASRSAWAAASSTATRACSEPSTPTTTTFSTGTCPDFARSARTCLSSVVSPRRSEQISGTVTVGHLAWAGRALLTEPEQPADETAPAARPEDQQFGGFGHLQQDTRGVAVLDRGVDVDRVAGDLVHGLLQYGLGSFADHRIVHGGVPAVKTGCGEDGHRVGGYDMQRATAALRLARGPHQGALAVVRTVDTDYDPPGSCRSAGDIPAGSGCTCPRPMGSASSRFLPDVAAILPDVSARSVHSQRARGTCGLHP